MHRFFAKAVFSALTAASCLSLTQVPVRAQFPAQQPLYISNFTGVSIGTVAPVGGNPAIFVNSPGRPGDGLMSFPDGMAFDAEGNLFVTVLYGNCGGVTRVTPNGAKTLYAVCNPNDPEHNTYNPTGLTIDRAGNLFVANQDYGTISKVSANGSRDPATGALYGTLYASGGGLERPDGLVLDSAGNLYVANIGNTITRSPLPS